MALTKTRVTGRLPLPNDEVWAGSYVQFQLRAVDTDKAGGAVLMSKPAIAELDENGGIAIDLWPNGRGDRDTVYQVKAYLLSPVTLRAAETDLGIIVVPPVGPVDLVDLLQISAPVPNVPDALAQALAAAAVATGAAKSVEAVVIDTAAVKADRVATEFARDQAGAYAASGATAARYYDTIAEGRNAVANGESFGVKAGLADGLATATLFRRESATTQSVIVEPAAASQIRAETARASATESELLIFISRLRQSVISLGGDPGFDLPGGYIEPLFGSSARLAEFEYSRGGSGRFVLAGEIVGSEAALRASTALTKVGADLVTSTPWVSSERSPWFTNQEFNANVAGWIAEGSVTWSPDNAGQLVFEAGGGTRSHAMKKVMPDDGSLAGKCLRFNAQVARGTTINSIQVCGTTYAQHFRGNISRAAPDVSTNVLTWPATPGYLSLKDGRQAYIGICGTSASNNGTFLMPEMDVREARPFQAFPQGAWDMFLEFNAPTSVASDVVLFRGYAADGASAQPYNIARIDVILRASDGHIIYLVRYDNTTYAQLDMGAAKLGESNLLALRMKNNDHAFSLNGSEVTFNTNLRAVGFSHIQFHSFVERIAFWPTEGSNAWLKRVTGGSAPIIPIWAEGDSMMAGAYGIRLWEMIQQDTGIPVINAAQGGNTWATITDRILATLAADPEAKNRTLVIFDGSANGFTTVADVINRLRAVVAAFGSENWIYVPPLVGRNTSTSIGGGNSAYYDNMQLIKTTAITEFGQHHVYSEIWEDLQAEASGPDDQIDVELGVIPRSLFYTPDGGATWDVTHLGSVANHAISEGVTPKIMNVRSLVGIAA